ncbi:hypothetical protein D1872_312440 [compost metagenome]
MVPSYAFRPSFILALVPSSNCRLRLRSLGLSSSAVRRVRARARPRLLLISLRATTAGIQLTRISSVALSICRVS